MFAEANVVKEHGQLIVTHGSDKECYVEIYKNPVYQEVESREKGRPIYLDVDFISIQFPGDKTKKVVRPINDDDKMRFGAHWKQFVETGVVSQVGTPLEEWPQVTRSQALELKGLGIHTVEQLANIGDNLLGFLGAREYREQARAYIEKASGMSAKFDALQAQFEALLAQNAAALERTQAAEAEKEAAAADAKRLLAEIDAMRATVNEAKPPIEATQPERKKPGRKPKAPAIDV